MTDEIVQEHSIAVSRACKIVNLVRSQYYYSSKKDDSQVIESLQELAFKHPSYGFRKLFAYLRRSGKPWNHKRVHRIYRALKLNKRRKGKRRLPKRVRQPLNQPAQVNEIWSVDFMSDSLIGSRKFRTFNVIDDCSREALIIDIDTSLSAKRVIRTLNRIGESRGFPKAIRSDNGPEFTSKDFAIWCEEKGIETRFIQPGKPTQNGYIERFNRLYREAVLDAYLFFDLDQVRQLTAEWIEEYNQRRPHEGLGNMTPVEWKESLVKKKIQQQLTV